MHFHAENSIFAHEINKIVKMKKILLTLMTGLLLVGCAKNDNPFLETYKNKYNAPPFDKIKNEHYMPAFKEGIKQHQTEIDAIANNTEVAHRLNQVLNGCRTMF